MFYKWVNHGLIHGHIIYFLPPCHVQGSIKDSFHTILKYKVAHLTSNCDLDMLLWDWSVIESDRVFSCAGTSRVFSAETFQCLCQLEGHEGEISKVNITLSLHPRPVTPASDSIILSYLFTQSLSWFHFLSRSLPVYIQLICPLASIPASCCRSSSSLHIHTAVCVLIALFISSFLRPILKPSCHNFLSFHFHPPPDHHHHQQIISISCIEVITQVRSYSALIKRLSYWHGSDSVQLSLSRALSLLVLLLLVEIGCSTCKTKSTCFMMKRL